MLMDDGHGFGQYWFIRVTEAKILKENIGQTRSVSEATLENVGGDQTSKSHFKKRQIYLKRLSMNTGHEDTRGQGEDNANLETIYTVMSMGKIESRYRHSRISTQ